MQQSAGPLGFLHSTKKELFGTNNKSAPIRAKLDLRKAPRVAKNDLTTPLIYLRCAMCGASADNATILMT
jgi:hypothetical protein